MHAERSINPYEPPLSGTLREASFFEFVAGLACAVSYIMGVVLAYVASQLAVAAYGLSAEYFYHGVAGVIGGLALVVHGMLIHAAITFRPIRSRLLIATLFGTLICAPFTLALSGTPALGGVGAVTLVLLLVQYLEKQGVIDKRQQTKRPSISFDE